MIDRFIYKFCDVLDDPGGDHEWRVHLRNCKLVRPGPPNQYYRLQIGRHNKVTVPEVDVEVMVDKESDAKEDDNKITTSAGDIYKFQWEKKFVEGINLDNRGILSK